jgi:S-disulfanyl-L-cysteine oxidoreductase SoxD
MRSIHCLFNVLLVPVMALAACVAALAQLPTYKVGKAASPEEIRRWDISVDPAGNGLPSGSGTAKKGAEIFAQKCGLCHGRTGEGPANLNDPPLARGNYRNLARADTPELSAPTLWEFIKHSMPPVAPAAQGSLTDDEAYALTAYLLYRRGIIQENDLMDAQSLRKVKMPEPKEKDKAPSRYLAAPVP